MHRATHAHGWHRGGKHTHNDDRKSSSRLSHLNLQMLKIRGEDQQGTECLSSTTGFVCILIFFGQFKSNQSISSQGSLNISQHPSQTVGKQRATNLPLPYYHPLFLSISHVSMICGCQVIQCDPGPEVGAFPMLCRKTQVPLKPSGRL